MGSSKGGLKRRQVASRPVGFLSRFSTPCEQDEGNMGTHRPPRARQNRNGDQCPCAQHSPSSGKCVNGGRGCPQQHRAAR